MDQNPVNPYSTEIPVSEAEKELRHTSPTPPTLHIPTTPDATPPQPPPDLPSRHSTSPLGKLPMIIVGILLLGIGFLVGYIVRGTMASTTPPPVAKKVVPPTAPTPTAIPTITPDASMSASSNHFSAAELGITFDTAKTLPDSGDKTVLTQIDGSRVYVYVSGTEASTGQYVDILSKISTDSTIVAAQKITAGDPDFASCTFQVSAQTIYPATYERVVPNCSGENGQGLRYFLSDSKNPSKLLFISIGQYGIQASSQQELMWQDTLRFL